VTAEHHSSPGELAKGARGTWGTRLAEARGLTLGEWFRELVLAELIAHPAEQVILAEVLALRMLYLNTVQIIGALKQIEAGRKAELKVRNMA